MEYVAAELDIPHFGQAFQLVFECASCGFRHADFSIGSTQEPRRFTYVVKAADDMSVRVVRSTSGTVRIPELGVLIEPGPASDAYVSNIEGVLVRVDEIVGQLERDAETAEERSRCTQLRHELAEARKGQFPLTFILEDPFGNSAIVHEDARVEMIPSSEAAQLKTGEITLQLQGNERDKEVGNGHKGEGGDGHRRPSA